MASRMLWSTIRSSRSCSVAFARTISNKAKEIPALDSASQTTSFPDLDIYAGVAVPATCIDACLSDGFHLSSGQKVTGGDGIFLFGGEVVRWRPWLAAAKSATTATATATAASVVKNGIFGKNIVDTASIFGVLEHLYPRPDLLIFGTGRHTAILAPQLRQKLIELGVRVEVSDTRNAAATWNLLSIERGTGVVAAMIPAI